MWIQKKGMWGAHDAIKQQHLQKGLQVQKGKQKQMNNAGSGTVSKKFGNCCQNVIEYYKQESSSF